MAKAKPTTDEVKNMSAQENAALIDGAPKQAGHKFKVKKLVTVPLLKFVIDQPIYVKITSPIFLGKEVKGSGDSSKMEAAHLANVINLETGEEQQIIIAKVVQGVLDEEYPNQGYVGKAFQLTKLAKGSGKRYNPYTVAELDVD